MAERHHPAITRRDFVGASAAVIAATALPHGLRAQSSTYRRYEISSPNMPPRMLESYKKAIRKMLELPPTDPLNWYRNAFVHTFDCTHNNWWFLVWHRAYLGWFEKTCRKLSEDPEFALPYWDWTENPRIPPAMFEDVLNPNNDAYIGNFEEFKRGFKEPVECLWASFTPAQSAQLARRKHPYNDATDFWMDIRPMFFERPEARGQELDSRITPYLTNDHRMALIESFFAGSMDQGAGFGSQKSKNHQSSPDNLLGTLEARLHGYVHWALGIGTGNDPKKGFMTDFLSPVDPIFFLHHANIDRLWDVWARRQLERQRPAVPVDTDLGLWSDEQFLFFRDEDGNPVSRTSAGDYAPMSVFDYDYEPGRGEELIPVGDIVLVGSASNQPSRQRFSARITPQAGEPAGGVAEVPGDLLQPSQPEMPPRSVGIALDLSPADRGRAFRVIITPPGKKPIDAGLITPFGAHTGRTTFTLPLPENLEVPSGQNVPLDIRVLPLEEPSAPIGKETPIPGMEAPMQEERHMAPEMKEREEAPQVTAIHVWTN